MAAVAFKGGTALQGRSIASTKHLQHQDTGQQHQRVNEQAGSWIRGLRLGASPCSQQLQVQLVGDARLEADRSGKHHVPGVCLQSPWDAVVLGQHMPTHAVGRHRPWALHGQFYLCPLLRDLGLQAQQQVVIHSSWYRGHQEFQCLAFPQPNEAPACPGWSSPGGRHAFHHIKHLTSGVLSFPH